jgi:hypothetical protein
VAAACAVKSAAPNEVSTRARRSGANAESSAAARCPTAKSSCIETSSFLRSKRLVAPASNGALRHTVKAKALTSCPATGSVTSRPSASAGNIPGTMSVPVPMMKLPKQRAIRLAGMRTRFCIFYDTPNYI